jgi:aconitate hydratase
MALNVTQKLIGSHLVHGRLEPGAEIGLRIDQTLAQDAAAALTMLEFEAMAMPRVRTELSVLYTERAPAHADAWHGDDLPFVQSACRKFGVWLGYAVNGASHCVHMERFGTPGRTLLGCDSHASAAGALGMLAIGAGSVDVAAALAGAPFEFDMPEILGVRLRGELPRWVSAGDLALELLRRHGAHGAAGRIIEFHGPGLLQFSAMDRHLLAHMGAQLGATSTVFPSDARAEEFLRAHKRTADWRELRADHGAGYDLEEDIELSVLEPLLARPGHPADVAPVTTLAGERIDQAQLGFAVHPGLRDFVIAALMLEGRRIHPDTAFDINPGSDPIFEALLDLGLLGKLVHAGARIHPPGCTGCIGSAPAHAPGPVALRARGADDPLYLCSVETAAASLLAGVITDPRRSGDEPPCFKEPPRLWARRETLIPPEASGTHVEIARGPGIRPLPELDPLPDALAGPVLIKVGDDLSSDDIMPSRARVVPIRGNIAALSELAFAPIDEDYYKRARQHRTGGSFVVAGLNYGQGSRHEHAALALHHLGMRAVIAKGFARDHWQSLVDFAVLPLTFLADEDYDQITRGDDLVMRGLRQALGSGSREIRCLNRTVDREFRLTHALSERQVRIVLDGGLINFLRARPRHEPRRVA